MKRRVPVACVRFDPVNDRFGSIFDQVQWGLPIGPFRLALRADIPPAHLATRVFGEFARTNKALGLLD